MTTQLTSTTGTVNGIQEIRDFVNMCHSHFNDTQVVQWVENANFLQYTLLTENRIRIYLSRVDEMVSTWERAYQKMSTKDQHTRLQELNTWDQPRQENKNEHAAKITALKNLLGHVKEK